MEPDEYTAQRASTLFQGPGPLMDPDDPVIPRKRLVAVALGEGVLDGCGADSPFEIRQRRADEVAEALHMLIALHQMVVTYSAAPRLGLLGWRPGADGAEGPLALQAAATAGVDGLLLGAALRHASYEHPFASVGGAVVVDAHDPEFAAPTGHDLASGRLVPSPFPLGHLATNHARHLLEAGVNVLCAGGGGMTMATDKRAGRCRVVDATTDHDLASAVLGAALSVNTMVFVTPDHAGADPVRRAQHAADLFTRSTGQTAVVGKLDELFDMVVAPVASVPDR